MKVKIQRDSMSDDGEGSLDPSNSEQLPRQLHGSRVVLSKPTKLGAGHLLGMGAVNPLVARDVTSEQMDGIWNHACARTWLVTRPNKA